LEKTLACGRASYACSRREHGEKAWKEGAMQLLYIVTKGTSDATLASVPLHIAANGSLEIGQEVSVILAGDATDLIVDDNAQRVEGVGVPPMRDLLSKLGEHEVPVYV
jgi:predicted peroxiredoxin